MFEIIKNTKEVITISILFLLSSCNAFDVAPRRSKKTIISYDHMEELYMGHTVRGPVYSYKVNNKKYDYEFAANQQTAGEDSYIIEYDSLHPIRSKILLDKPVFLSNGPKRRNIAKIESIKTKSILYIIFGGYKVIEFSFHIGKDPVWGSQYIRTKTLKEHKEIKVATFFEVEYPAGQAGDAILNFSQVISQDSVTMLKQYFEAENHTLDSLDNIKNLYKNRNSNSSHHRSK